MHGPSLGLVVLKLEVRNLQVAYSFDGSRKGCIGVTVVFPLAQDFSLRPKGTKDLGPIESLAGAMFAEAHDRILARGPPSSATRAIDLMRSTLDEV